MLKSIKCQGGQFNQRLTDSNPKHDIPEIQDVNKKSIRMLLIAASLATLGGMALAAQDRKTVAVSGTETTLKAILANPVMIRAYKTGVPGNGQTFPEGSRIVKIQWTKAKNPESPYFVEIPQTLQTIPGHARLGIRAVRL